MWQMLSGVGHLTRTPELRYSANGIPIVSTGVAFNRKFKQGEELKEEVCFIDCVIFGKTGEYFAQWHGKGDRVLLSGRLQQRRWEDQGGGKHSKHEFVVETWKSLKPRTDGQATDHGAEYEQG